MLQQPLFNLPHETLAYHLCYEGAAEGCLPKFATCEARILALSDGDALRRTFDFLERVEARLPIGGPVSLTEVRSGRRVPVTRAQLRQMTVHGSAD